MTRKIEMIVGVIATIISTVVIGGFSIIVNKLDFKQFEEIMYPYIVEQGIDMSLKEGFEYFNSLASYLAIVCFVVLVLGTITSFICKYIKNSLIVAICYAITGLALLIGTQFIAFPIAFLFFVSSSLCIIRKDKHKIEGD